MNYQYMNYQGISIQKCANGWIVSVPIISKMPAYPDYPDSEQMIRKHAQIMREEMQGDPELRKIQSENSDNQNGVSENKRDLNVLENVYVFMSTKDVINFLRFELDK
jgi:hypothetical protein